MGATGNTHREYQWYDPRTRVSPIQSLVVLAEVIIFRIFIFLWKAQYFLGSNAIFLFTFEVLSLLQSRCRARCGCVDNFPPKALVGAVCGKKPVPPPCLRQRKTPNEANEMAGRDGWRVEPLPDYYKASRVPVEES